MKNYHLKLILTFFITSMIIILSMGITLIILNSQKFDMHDYNKKIGIVTIIAIIFVAIVSIIMAIVTLNKIIKPMSKMLKSANTSSDNGISDDDNVYDMVNGIQGKIIDANRKKMETDTILKHLTDGVISFDMQGNVNYINPAAKVMLEITDSDNTFNSIFDKYENNNINLEKIIYLEDWTSSEITVDNNQGTMKLLFVPFKDEFKRPTGLMVVVQDITEHVKLNRMRKEFVADVSHELKTPLTSIKGFVETLIDGVDDKETQMHFLKVIDDNANRMEKLVQDLLILSKYDKKIETNNLKEFDLGVLAKECTEKFEIEVKKKNQSLQCYVTANVPKVYADRDGIERVITNIISNSVKYTKENGKIDVYVGYVHNDAYVKIKDNGIGIPEKDLGRIYERFYRVDKARSRASGGTGLGLSIAKEIIEQNNGSINITSKYGEGTEVVLKIPVKK